MCSEAARKEPASKMDGGQGAYQSVRVSETIEQFVVDNVLQYFALPYHAEMDCGNPRRPRYGVVEFSFTSYGWTVVFQCRFGYVMEGADSAVCDESGHWSRNPPICRGMIYCILNTTSSV